MSKILDLYDSMQSQLGVDKISFAAAQSAKTPYSDDSSFNSDLTDARLKDGRGGTINDKVKYSDTVDRG
jgi:hypothetical protein